VAHLFLCRLTAAPGWLNTQLRLSVVSATTDSRLTEIATLIESE